VPRPHAMLDGAGERPYVHTGGTGSGATPTESSLRTAPFRAAALMVWQRDSYRRVLNTPSRAATPFLVLPGVVWGPAKAYCSACS